MHFISGLKLSSPAEWEPTKRYALPVGDQAIGTGWDSELEASVLAAGNPEGFAIVEVIKSNKKSSKSSSSTSSASTGWIKPAPADYEVPEYEPPINDQPSMVMASDD